MSEEMDDSHSAEQYISDILHRLIVLSLLLVAVFLLLLSCPVTSRRFNFNRTKV